MRSIFISLLITFIVLLGLQAVTKPVLADELIFQDDFSGDLHQWQQTQGLPEDWQIRDGQLEAYVNNSFSYSELIPTDAAWPKSWANTKYELDYTPIEGADRNISFNIVDRDHWYELHFVDGTLNLLKFSGNQIPINLDYPANVTLGHTYHLEITFYSGLIQVVVDSQLIAEQYDWTYSGEAGKIGVKITTGTVFPTRVRFDNLKVTHVTTDGAQLAVPLIKQTDPQWANLIYDSAKDWSQNPMIGNWGCALTSMVMIMQYYGMNYLPDGQALTPITLNDWLTSQPDGYVSPGLVNWPAISRLTAEISAQYQTVKLEYSFHPVFDLIPDTVKQLENHQPAIIEIPERRHFVTAIGYSGNHQDLVINDPYYSYQKISEYQVEDMTGRFFQPSHTDLSYLEFVHSPNIELRLHSENQQLQWTTESESLGGEDGETPVTKVVTELLAKPATGAYSVQILRRDSAAYQLKILSYDQLGSVSTQDFSAAANTQPAQVSIHFVKEVSEVSPTLQDFNLQLDQQLTNLGFTRLSAYYRLKYLTELAVDNPVTPQLPYLELLQTEVTDLAWGIHEPTLVTLNSILTTLKPGHPP